MTDRTPSHDTQALFARLVKRFGTDPSVTSPSVTKGGKFGDSTLKVDAKIFAFISKGKLVVKLPRQRVDELVASGTGRPVTIAPQHRRRWAGLADEARRFVAASSAKPRRR